MPHLIDGSIQLAGLVALLGGKHAAKGALLLEGALGLCLELRHAGLQARHLLGARHEGGLHLLQVLLGTPQLR